MRGQVRRAIAGTRAHPRHVVLAALVAGLLAVAAPHVVVLGLAVGAVALAGRPFVAVLAVAALVGGSMFADARLRGLDTGVLTVSYGQEVHSRATVLEPVHERAVGPAVARVRLMDGVGAGEQAVLRMRKGVYRTGGGAGPGVWDGAEAGASAVWPEVGDIVSISGTVARLGFADAYQRRRNAHAAIAAQRVLATGARRSGVAGLLDGVRRHAEDGLAQGLKPSEAALLRGMVLGEDERLTDGVRDDFQKSGLAHILAVSGQNVVLLIVLVLGACALLGVPLRARLVLASAIVVLYVPLAGGGPSIQRAGIMGVAGLIAALAGRPARRWYALLLAAAATLMLNPRAVGEPGWQLSFAAVIALLVGAKPLQAALARRMPEPIADALAITLAATIGTAPLMALHFGQLSIAALPANLLAAPAIAPVMWLGVLAGVAGQLAAPLALPFSALTAPLLVYIQAVAHVCAAAPFSSVELHAPPGVIFAAWAAALVAAAVAWREGRRAATRWQGLGHGTALGRRRRTWLAVAGAATATTVLIVALPLRGASAAPLKPGELVVSFLDVGQGDATLVQFGTTAVLVDTGPPDGPILKRLAEARIKRLDALFLTHAEADHEGAAPAVIARYSPRLVVDGGAGWKTAVQRALPVALAAHRGRSLTPATGQAIDVGGLHFSVLWPPPDDRHEGNPNDHAIVSRLDVGAFSMLLTADAESNVTLPLELAPVDVLKVAHHGSADPGLPALLKRLRPRLAAIEVGRHNTYGHPTKTTLMALAHAVPTVVRTDEEGTIRLRVAGDRMWVQR
ncbi:ComEC/Rec2 family competence protein [Solirubrobacter ginsenosidimutans]|uniref:ComEC/Rec2 family competence protein n=1 Tax=Solirubrobacter ginsenosidimutans TaxID=490573 RepID=A0A9X3MVH4_9ACTN|nr:ComEC/Rec2 family competence protein [Solirubrobacter ginsenosidimutans]MDA0163489.1 ComEC/Rec2 family competence protein [Solirubrobacter ginsenosidimutans]